MNKENKIGNYIKNIEQETEEFKTQLSKMSPDDIWENSYTLYVYKEFSCYFIECFPEDFSKVEIEAIINNNISIRDLYDSLMGSDLTISNYEDVYQFILDYLKYNNLIKEEK